MNIFGKKIRNVSHKHNTMTSMTQATSKKSLQGLQKTNHICIWLMGLRSDKKINWTETHTKTRARGQTSNQSGILVVWTVQIGGWLRTRSLLNCGIQQSQVSCFFPKKMKLLRVHLVWFKNMLYPLKCSVHTSTTFPWTSCNSSKKELKRGLESGTALHPIGDNRGLGSEKNTKTLQFLSNISII